MQRLNDEEYKYVYSRSPRLCVDLAIVTPEGLLLSKRLIEPFKKSWHFPGGRVIYKESINDAISRIAKKEVGVKIKTEELLGFLEIINDGEYVHSVSLVFIVKINSGEVKGGDQAKQFKAFKKIPDNMHSSHKKFIKKYWAKILRLA
ncbi:MAG TPA: NUDIX domain-containing protein [Patescibacteria group bacterium]|nr:NUDIX domain-containing protein [Patescibacteria group bacterium]